MNSSDPSTVNPSTRDHHLARDTESMVTGNFETQFPDNLLEKDIGYAAKTAAGNAAMLFGKGAEQVNKDV